MKSQMRLRDLQRKMDEASSYEEWKEAALKHDELSGSRRWREVDQTDLYDYGQIRLRLDRILSLRARHDYSGLLYTLNEGIHGNMAGMGRAALHNRAKFGTKLLIEDYINEIDDAIRLLADLDDGVLPADTLEDFFYRANVCFGRTALMLSGGGVLGNYHLGVVKALIEQQLLPTVISGSSAGAFVSSIVGSHTDAEMLHMFEQKEYPFDMQQLDLDENSTEQHAFRGKHRQMSISDLQMMMEKWIPNMTFQEAFEKTGRQISISVAPAESHQRSRLLNAITSPNVTLRSAVQASGAVPGVFPPVTLMAKNARGEIQPYLPSRQWIDGSFTDDLPAKRLSRLYATNHTIVSMVNPLVLPILGGGGLIPDYFAGVTTAFQKMNVGFARELFKFYRFFSERNSHFLPKTNLWINMLHSVVDQDYTGDINIVPNFRWYNPQKMLAHISAEDRDKLILEGETSTYPKIETIRHCTKISRTLDEILGRYEGRGTIVSGSKKALAAKRRRTVKSAGAGGVKRPSRKKGSTKKAPTNKDKAA